MKILLDLPNDLTERQAASALLDITKAILFFEDSLLQMDGAMRVETGFGPCFVHMLDDDDLVDDNIIPFPTIA